MDKFAHRGADDDHLGFAVLSGALADDGNRRRVTDPRNAREQFALPPQVRVLIDVVANQLPDVRDLVKPAGVLLQVLRFTLSLASRRASPGSSDRR